MCRPAHRNTLTNTQTYIHGDALTQTHRYVRGDTQTRRDAEAHIDTQTCTQKLTFLFSLIATLPSKGGEIDGHMWD